MSRPIKTGLEYFPLDVDMDQDDKLFFIEAKYGLISFAIVVRTLMLIYKDGYYKHYSEDKEAFMLAKRLSADVNVLKNVINDCINEGLFNKNLFEKYRILTSRGIQKRYLEACSRRKEVSIIKEYCLVDPKNYKNLVFDYINPDNVDINPVNSNTTSPETPQSKGKESKVKESKVQNSTVCSAGGETHDTDNGEGPETPGVNEYPADFEAFWQAYPKARRKEKRAAYKAWKTRLKQGKAKGLTPDKLITAARHYAAEMAAKGKEPEYIKLPKTFLGPNAPFEEYIDPPPAQGLDPPKAWHKLKKYINPEEVFNYDSG